jgi:hypothetical protein
MGDRGNIGIRNANRTVWFYTHHFGSDMKELVREALARKLRWDDPPYLARIIFCNLIQHCGGLEGESGTGIDTAPNDNEHPFLIVDTAKQLVYEEPDMREGFEYLRKQKCMKPKTFEAFIKMKC